MDLVENLSKVYSSAFQGLLSNFLVTALVIMLVEGYCRLAQVRWKEHFSVDKAFLLSIGSSFVISALTWWLNRFPSSGTSIIGFCMFAFLLANCLLDSTTYTARTVGRQFVLKRGWWVVCLAISGAFLPASYLIDNPGIYLHLAGLAVFAFISAYFLKSSNPAAASRTSLRG